MNKKIEINGKKYQSALSAYKIFSEIFPLPDYFTYNLNSLEECMNDISWFGEDVNFEFTIHNSDYFIKGDFKMKEEVLDILKNIDLNHEDANKKRKFTLILK